MSTHNAPESLTAQGVVMSMPTTSPFKSTLMQELLEAQAAAARVPTTLQIRFLNTSGDEVQSLAFIYDVAYASHYLKQAESIARQHDVWADRVSFTLLNRDANPIVSATYRRYSIPTKWMF